MVSGPKYEFRSHPPFTSDYSPLTTHPSPLTTHPSLLTKLELVEPEVRAAVVLLGLPHFITPIRLEVGGIGLVGRRLHVWHAGSFGPLRGRHRPIVVGKVLVWVIVILIELVAGKVVVVRV